MPIYHQTYRSFDGTVRTTGRWWAVVTHEFRVLAKSRPFLLMFLMGYPQVLLRVLQIVAVDTLASNKNNQITQMVQSVMSLKITEGMFFDFIRLQAPIVFLATILAGAGMICDDLRHNLMDVYFSKAITWRDYVVGKLMTLIIIGMIFTAVPAMFLLLLHNLLAPSMQTIHDTYWLPVPILAFSTLLVVPCALGVLASSALFSSERYSAIGVFMVLFADLIIGQSMHRANPQLVVLAFPLALNRVGEELFFVRRPMVPISWEASIVFTVVVCLAAFWAICRKVKRAEVAT
ncbi:MAG: ABC transporter permease subunit [Candidatus Hydrogenedentes bacterium]|nr:ABC transporter permease subunit [Candidatus Hydrogenedentota bacterium]